MAEVKDAHLEGLTIIEKRLVKNYAITIMGNVHTMDDVKPAKLKPYVELEIAIREIEKLTATE